MTTARQRERAIRRRNALVEEISRMGWTVPGSITDRFTRCGNPTCRCRMQPPQLHGPYPTWTRKVDNKTVTRTLTPEQAERLRPWFDNNRRLRHLVTELEALSLQVVDDVEGWRQK